MEAILDARQVMAVLSEHKVAPPARLATALAVVDAFAEWKADDPMTPLLESLSTLDPADVPAALDEVADRLARADAAKRVLLDAIPATHRQVALALGQHAEAIIVSLRVPYMAAAAKLGKLAEVLPSDDPADAIAAGDPAVKALRAVPDLVRVLDGIRDACKPLNRRLGAFDILDPMLMVKVDEQQAATVRSLPNDGPGGIWLRLVRHGFELWLPTPAEAKAERERQQQQATDTAEAQRLAAATGPGSHSAYLRQYAPTLDTLPAA